MIERCRRSAEVELQQSEQSLQIADRQIRQSVVIVTPADVTLSASAPASAAVRRRRQSTPTGAVAERLRRGRRLHGAVVRQATTGAERRRRPAGGDLQRRRRRQLGSGRRVGRRRKTERRPTGLRRRTIGRVAGGVRGGVRRRRRVRRAREEEEEDADGVLAQSGVPARVNVRHEALSVELGTSRPRRRAAPHRDAGQDLVPEPADQVEEAESRSRHQRTPSASPPPAAATDARLSLCRRGRVQRSSSPSSKLFRLRRRWRRHW